MSGAGSPASGAGSPASGAGSRASAARPGGGGHGERASNSTAAGLVVEGLHVAFGTTTVVDGVSFRLAPGECVALVGESGSGKSVTARALLGLTSGAVTATRLDLDGEPLLTMSERALRRLRGARIGLILQDALVSLDPLRPVGREIDDVLRLHTRLTAVERRERVVDVLAEVGMPDPATRRAQRSGELSGGLRQRALIAAALVARPGVVIADEPTTALDAEVQRVVVDRLAALRDSGTAVLAISHDLEAVRRLADRVLVMRGGRVVEEGPVARILDAPEHEYTRRLVAALPAGKPRGSRLSATVPASAAATAASTPTASAAATATAPSGPRSNPPASPQVAATTDSRRDSPDHSVVLSADGLARRFAGRAGATLAVDDVSLELRAGETLGLVGASGSGKTTTARILLGLETPDAGTVTLLGEPWSPLPERARRERRRDLGAIYQDALSSFDPRQTVGRILDDALAAGRRAGRSARTPDVARLLDEVGLPAAVAQRFPATLSGGQRQRVAIARALAPRPRVLICDEPVSSLDVTVQAQVLDLLDDLQRRHGLAYLFISHDLDVIRHVSDRVAVMTGGRIIEHGTTEHVFTAPNAAYTRALLASHP